jgi:Rrf2 family cysteine metabolism transcriptional repressor
MRLSTKGEYGMRAMVELARNYGRGPISLSDVAQAQNIPLAYLEHLIATLRRADLVESTRGVRGGYQLRREPEKVSVGDIVRALEGPIAPVECVSENRTSACCEKESECATRQVWVRMRDSIAEALDSTTLADLVESPTPAKE